MYKFVFKTYSKDALKGLVQFGCVGLTGVIVDMGILVVLRSRTDWPLLVIKSIACEAAIINNFVLNDAWTFREYAEKGWSARLKRGYRFNMVSLLGLAVNVMLLQGLVQILGFEVCAANLLSIGMVAFLNYSLSKQYAWH
jgi:dolichol-phosphate mannosyltransferase